MGDRSFGYSAQVRPFLWVFLVLTPVEILLVDLLMPWFWLRAVLLVFGLLSALLLAWLLWMLHKFKHEIDDEYLWLRYAREFEYRRRSSRTRLSTCAGRTPCSCRHPQAVSESDQTVAHPRLDRAVRNAQQARDLRST